MCDSWPESGSRTSSSPSRRRVARTSSSRSAFLRTAAAELPVPEGGERVRQAQERVDRRPHEELEGRQHGDGVPGQVEDQVVAADAEGHGLPRLHGHAPEELLDAELGLDLADEIVRADRGAAGGHEHVEAEQRALHRAAVLLLVVGHHPELRGDGTGEPERGGEQQAVRLVDLPRLERLAGLPQLGARHEDPHARPLRALHLGDAGRREGADLSRAEHHAGLEHRLARPDVASGSADVRACGHRRRDGEALARLLHDLDRHDRVGPLGDRPAGGDAHRLARGQRTRGRAARGDPLDDGKNDRRGGRVRRAQRVSVHRRAGERRQVDDGRSALREDAPGRPLDRHALGLQGLRPLENEALGLGDGDQLGHEAVR